MPQACSFDAFSAGNGGNGMGYSPSMLMPPPASYPNGSYMPIQPGTSFSPLMSSPLRPNDSPYDEYYGFLSQHGSYPQPHPYQQYSMGVPITQTMSHQSTTTSYSGMNTDTDADEGFASMLNIDGEGEGDDDEYRQSSAEPTASSLKASTIPKVAQPPRPPNAWILYRSEKLRAIREGKQIEGLDKVMTDSGLSSSASASSGEESLMNGEGGDSKPKQRKGKKGVKEPTEGLLRMGKGKTGRGLPQAHISKMISELWKAETPAIRGEYERRSELKKLEVSKFWLAIESTDNVACGKVSRLQVCADA
jgi:hypothetical protein